ncbi:MAG: type II toxin-antitoxin system HicB family antitoxin [Chloroflexi bacterium]|nr:type II toxin-antitoxin system HicB family antitoxin [Chloroflexota bacterium]
MSDYQFTVVIEPDDEGFHAYVPALPGCHTFGATVEEARTNIIEAMELHIASMKEDGESVPVFINIPGAFAAPNEEWRNARK